MFIVSVLDHFNILDIYPNSSYFKDIAKSNLSIIWFYGNQARKPGKSIKIIYTGNEKKPQTP